MEMNSLNAKAKVQILALSKCFSNPPRDEERSRLR